MEHPNVQRICKENQKQCWQLQCKVHPFVSCPRGGVIFSKCDILEPQNGHPRITSLCKDHEWTSHLRRDLPQFPTVQFEKGTRGIRQNRDIPEWKFGWKRHALLMSYGVLAVTYKVVIIFLRKETEYTGTFFEIPIFCPIGPIGQSGIVDLTAQAEASFICSSCSQILLLRLTQW